MKYKYRLILDESFSFGTVGRTGRGLTELYNVPVSPHNTAIFLHSDPDNKKKIQASKVDMLLGSIANGLCSSGGFCAGSRNVIDHQVCNVELM